MTVSTHMLSQGCWLQAPGVGFWRLQAPGEESSRLRAGDSMHSRPEISTGAGEEEALYICLAFPSSAQPVVAVCERMEIRYVEGGGTSPPRLIVLVFLVPQNGASVVFDYPGRAVVSRVTACMRLYGCVAMCLARFSVRTDVSVCTPSCVYVSSPASRRVRVVPPALSFLPRSTDEAVGLQ